MSLSGNRSLVLHVLAGLGRADCQVLAPVRSYFRQEDLENLPRNAHITDQLPVHQLGDAVDLAATRDGEGAVQTSCARGWPFIGTPLQSEQRFNVQRCATFGPTRLMSQREVRRTDRAGLVRQALADDGMRSRARRMIGLVEGLDGPGQVTEATCKLL